jgi:hypothetical protein
LLVTLLDTNVGLSWHREKSAAAPDSTLNISDGKKWGPSLELELELHFGEPGL